MRSPTSLVTGGAGFIGSHVADHLLKAGHRVVVLDDLSGGFRDNVPGAAELVVGSILDRPLVERLFVTHRYDYVYHLAAYAAEGLSHFIRRFNYENNLVGSVNLITAAINSGSVRAFVFTSSIAVYGRHQTPMHEALTPEPEDPYGIAKHAAERELAAAHAMFGLPYVIVRPHNVYGERQNLGDRYRNVVAIFMNQIMRGEPMTIFGDGRQTRAFSYIGDVAPLIARAVDVPQALGQVFNVGADTPHTVHGLALAVAAAMGVEPRIVHLPARHEVVHAFADHDRARRVFAVAAPVPLADGLARMAAWARAHGQRETPPFPDIEIRKGLPPGWLD
ncbi:MAG TPA: NAD-dependent epimerase/dehydratase family protein [Vicinamibacterales bacterium]|nr:NAD-dependent epimerase/dehydratase family protein [Vicinamibacterales bacterium]